MAIDARPALTRRQVDVLRAIEEFVDGHGFPPSLKELGLMLDMSSLAAITEHLQSLVRKGYLAREPGGRRAIRILVASREASLLEPRPLRKASYCSHCLRRRTA